MPTSTNTEHRITVRAVTAVMGVAVAAALTMGGAASANATPGRVDTSPGTVDYDGTQGRIDYDATTGDIVEAVTGDQYGPATRPADKHTVVSDACYVKGSTYCLAANGYGPETISPTSGVKDGPGSALDSDGFQTTNGG